MMSKLRGAATSGPVVFFLAVMAMAVLGAFMGIF
jgi:hypothetical protein